MNSGESERQQHLTVLSISLDGFSRVPLALDQGSRVRLLLDSYYPLLERHLVAHQGRLFRKEGEAAWCGFPGATAAALCAIAIQEELAQRNRLVGGVAGLSVRMGMHSGEVVVTGEGDVLGHTLSLAKRLETLCPAGSLNMSAEAQASLDRRLPWEIVDLGTVELKGVGPHQIFQARPTPQSPQEATSARLIVGLDGRAVPHQWTGWERVALGLATHCQGYYAGQEDYLGYLILPPSRESVEAIFDHALSGARRVLLLGQVVLAREGDNVETPYGESLDRATRVLRLGYEAGLVLISETALALLSTESYLEPYCRLDGPAGLFYRLVAQESPLTFAHRPCHINAWSSRGPLDLTVGAPGQLAPADLLEPLHSPAITLCLRARALLTQEPVAYVPVVLAALASNLDLRLPDGLLAMGGLANGEGDLSLESSGRWGEMGYTPNLALGPPNTARTFPGAIEVANVEALHSWLLDSQEQAHIEALRQALSEKSLTIILAAPLGGEGECRSLAEMLRASCGGESDQLWQAAEEAEEELGPLGLVRVLRQWSAGLQESPLLDRLGASGAPVLTLFPDPRISPHWHSLAGDAPMLTEARFEELPRRLRLLPESVNLALTSHTLLIVACPSSEEGARWFLRTLRLVLPASAQQKIFLCCPISPGGARWWDRRGVVILQEEAEEVTRQLALPPSRGGGGPSRATRIPSKPYKFLDYYEAQDSTIFFGREVETERMLARVTALPLTVLFGRSGVGKSSLLRAGVLSRFPRPRHLVLTARCLSDPVHLIRGLLEGVLQRESTGQSLVTLAGEVTRRLNGRLFLVLDQFEEFFVRLDEGQRQAFVSELAAWMAAPPAGAHVVLSLREDFLAEMSIFEEDIPMVLRNRLRLLPLTREQARAAIVEPARLFHLEVEEALVEALLQELFEEGVDPPELQIVLDRLYARRQGGPLTLELYRRLGGVQSILVDYLHSALQAADPVVAEQSKRVLGAMVTAVGTKAVVSLEQIVENTGLMREPAQGALERLVEARLIRSFSAEEGSATLYEMTHEYIIQEVLSWASEDEIAVRHAQLVLRAELENWQRFASLMSADRLDMLCQHRQRLTVPPPERALILRASALHQRPLEPWLCDQLDQEVLVGLLRESNSLTGAVCRAIVEAIFRVGPASESISQALLECARHVINPTVIENLRPLAGERPALFEELLGCLDWRFFGPERLVQVPAGGAWLGSTMENKQERCALCRPDQAERIQSEAPWGLVDVEEFWIDRQLVSNDEYTEFQPKHRYRYPPGQGHHPAVYVSWYEACDYARWVGKSLPTQEQWEKAARGSQGWLFPWGDRYDAERLNAHGQGTTPVDSYPDGVSPYGCLNMAGNVREWTASAWDSQGPFKTQKGGSTADPPPLQQVSSRFEAFPDFILQWVGFRTVTTKPPAQDQR